MDTHIHIEVHRAIQNNTQTHRNTYIYTQTTIWIYRCIQISIHRYTHIHRDNINKRHTHKCTYICTQTPIHMYTSIQTSTLGHTDACTHTHRQHYGYKDVYLEAHRYPQRYTYKPGGTHRVPMIMFSDQHV